jgi:CO/xanthine dehydrogenase Mo-binding subunit
VGCTSAASSRAASTLGSSKTGQGPAAASPANAIANATGKRLRNLPLTRKRIKNAVAA